MEKSLTLIIGEIRSIRSDIKEATNNKYGTATATADTIKKPTAKVAVVNGVPNTSAKPNITAVRSIASKPISESLSCFPKGAAEFLSLNKLVHSNQKMREFVVVFILFGLVDKI